MEQAYNFLITRLYTTILVIVRNVKDLLLRQKYKGKKMYEYSAILQVSDTERYSVLKNKNKQKKKGRH